MDGVEVEHGDAEHAMGGGKGKTSEGGGKVCEKGKGDERGG